MKSIFKRIYFHKYTFYTLLSVTAALTLYAFVVEPLINQSHGSGTKNHAIDGGTGPQHRGTSE